MPESKSGHTLDEIELAESELAESRDRLKKLRNVQSTLFAGSAERAQAARIFDEIENLHQVLDRLCHRLRGRPH